MLVLFTCSQDVTADWLMPFLKDIEVFRFDIDKWRQYDWDFSSENAACMYVRKPMFFEMLDIPAGGSFENWCRSEVENLWRDMYHRFHFENRLALVHPPKFELYKHFGFGIVQSVQADERRPADKFKYVVCNFHIFFLIFEADMP